jgi:hypothetical protein
MYTSFLLDLAYTISISSLTISITPCPGINTQENAQYPSGQKYPPQFIHDPEFHALPTGYASNSSNSLISRPCTFCKFQLSHYKAITMMHGFIAISQHHIIQCNKVIHEDPIVKRKNRIVA